jgi:hypothetical protein
MMGEFDFGLKSQIMEHQGVVQDYVGALWASKTSQRGQGHDRGLCVRYLSVTEGSRAMLRHQEWYLGGMEGFLAMLGVTVEYLDITKGSGAKIAKRAEPSSPEPRIRSTTCADPYPGT